jgi:hypothetical protein
MLETTGVEALLIEIIEMSRSSGAAGFSALFSNWRSRIHHLGVAFGTKLVYFASGPAVRPRPLIYDQFVASGLIEIAARPFPRANGRVLTEDYDAYLKLADQIALSAGASADDVEYALFNLGKTLRQQD